MYIDWDTALAYTSLGLSIAAVVIAVVSAH